jgi:hypothetical protein
MRQNSRSQIQQAQQLYRSGAQDEARRLIASVIKAEPDNSAAWLIAAQMAATPEQRLRLAQKALDIDPFSQEAERLVSALTGGAQKPVRSAAGAPPANPLPLYIGIGLAVVVLAGLLIYAALNLSASASRAPAATRQPPTLSIVVSPAALPSATARPEDVTPTRAATLTPTPAAYDLTGTAFRAIDQTEQAALRAEATAAVLTAAPGG